MKKLIIIITFLILSGCTEEANRELFFQWQSDMADCAEITEDWQRVEDAPPALQALREECEVATEENHKEQWAKIN